MKIATWNVNGIRARAGQVSEFLERENPDVLCLQELKASIHQVPLECRVTGYHIYWHGSTLKAYAGVSLHIKHAVGDAAFGHPEFDMESRIVTAQVGNTVFASVYVPNGGRDYPAKVSFMRSLGAWTRRVHAEGKELVLCGDINIARTEMDVHPRERKPVIGQLPEERALFEELLDDQLVDVGRARDPDNPNLFTWWAPWRNLRQRNIGWRLDYVLASKPIAARALSCTVQREFGTSDHGPVLMTTT
ncbi:MAG TPA: exodeoxyribonuclease III [Burkholderiales bacterium]|nr:exodeoxyribonuclease III [Burkholderiales bacterium]